jgi:hypothetical protein
VRRECLDWTPALGRRHLEGVLREYVAHYNAKRPHRGIDLRALDWLQIPPHRFPACCACEEATSWAALSTSTNWPREAESRVSVPFRMLAALDFRAAFEPARNELRMRATLAPELLPVNGDGMSSPL